MTFWVYNPLELAKPSNFLLHKSKGLGDVLNFLTIIMVLFTVYAKKYIPQINWQKFFSISLLTILLAGMLLTSKDTAVKNEKIPKYANYKFSLSVD